MTRHFADHFYSISAIVSHIFLVFSVHLNSSMLLEALKNIENSVVNRGFVFKMALGAWGYVWD
jgi:hypothetical protein